MDKAPSEGTGQALGRARLLSEKAYGQEKRLRSWGPSALGCSAASLQRSKDLAALKFLAGWGLGQRTFPKHSNTP